MERLLRQSEEERVTVVEAGGDKAMDKNRSGVGAEGRAEMINVAEMKICGPGNVIDMRVEG